MVDGRALGVLGRSASRGGGRYDLDGRRVYVAELDADVLAQAASGEVRFSSLPRYPAVQRDMALLVPKSLAAAAGRRGHPGAQAATWWSRWSCSTYTKGRRWTPATEAWRIPSACGTGSER